MIAFVLAAILSIPYTQPTDLKDIKPFAGCEQYHNGDCKNWKLALWIPQLGPGFGEDRKAKNVPFVDRFVPEPIVGTNFSYGTAGPPRGIAIYDAAERVAYYTHGCCAWRSKVLAAGVGAPPLAVMNRGLGHVRTERGLYLGMPTRLATMLYGDAPAKTVTGAAGVTLRSYGHQFPAQCEQDVDLGFYRDRLIYISITNAC